MVVCSHLSTCACSSAEHDSNCRHKPWHVQIHAWHASRVYVDPMKTRIDRSLKDYFWKPDRTAFRRRQRWRVRRKSNIGNQAIVWLTRQKKDFSIEISFLEPQQQKTRCPETTSNFLLKFSQIILSANGCSTQSKGRFTHWLMIRQVIS